MNRASLEDAILEWISSGDWTPNPERFEALALALFRVQYESCRPYALLCQSLDRTPDRVARASDIPAVPTGAFKEFDLRCFDANRTVRTFRTSGTSTDRRGELHLDRLDLYEASLLASLRHALLVGAIGSSSRRPIQRMRFLAASPAEAPDSSLSYMFGALMDAEGGSGSGFDLRSNRLQLDALRDAVSKAQQQDQPILIAGTAFAFVHFLDEADATGWELPSGSRLMETGGFKGRGREVPRDVLHESLASRFSIPETSLINQYGMTELGSQFYDSTLVYPDERRRKLIPPWTRVRFVDPATANDVEAGDVGILVIQDLANTGSVAAIQTADLGRAILDDQDRVIGFDVLGRSEGAEARGCSIATDVMLEASGVDQR